LSGCHILSRRPGQSTISTRRLTIAKDGQLVTLLCDIQ